MSDGPKAGEAPTLAPGARLVMTHTGEGPPVSDPRLSAERGLVPGAVLDRRYRLVARIGRGGFGDVWRAVELLPDGSELRDVGLKLLGGSFDDAGWSEEAKLLASLSHPSLVTIYAAGIISELNLPFVAMELLVGESLAELLRRRGRLPWRAALRYLRDVAAALDFIHDSGVIHLDLKPANLFLTTRGEIKVLDFGIAQGRAGRAAPRARSFRPSDPALSETAVIGGGGDAYAQTVSISTLPASDDSGPRLIVGTPGFVPPEVLQHGTPSAAADAYALGATLSQLVTGKLPHAVSFEPGEDSDAATFRKYFFELHDATLEGRLRDLAEDCGPAGVSALVLRLCSVLPGDRVPEQGLHALFDEVWQRPHGKPKAPYPGPRAFSALDEGLLFGREADVSRLLQHLQAESVVVISGPLGAGKTSFVNAALLPALARAGVDGRIDCQSLTIRMGKEAPDVLLARALASLPPPEEPADTEALSAGEGAEEPHSAPAWMRDNSPMVDALVRLTARHDALALVIDGFERVLSAKPEERQNTVRLICDLLRLRRVPGLRLVLVTEAWSVEGLSGLHEGLAPLPGVVRFLAPPPLAAAREIALSPGACAGWSSPQPDRLVALVERELAKNPVPLPAIAICLARAALQAPRTAALEELGPESRIETLAAYASFWCQSLSEDERQACLQVLLVLTDSQGLSTGRELSDIVRLSGFDIAPVQKTVRLLERGFLVRTHGTSAELAHPAFAHFEQLLQLRLASASLLGLRERLEEATQAWEASHQQPEYLDPGPLLLEIGRNDARILSHAAPGELEFLAASRRRRRRQRMSRFAAVGLLLLSVVGVLFGKQALDRRRQAAELAEREATERANMAELISRARGASDPYVRVAYLGQALRAGADDPALFIELLAAAEDLAPVRFLTTDTVSRPEMPWSDRWVLGIASGGKLLVADLEPPEAEPEVVEYLDMDADADLLRVLLRRPVVKELDLGAPVLDVVPFLFDTSVAVRTSTGSVFVVRMREEGEVAVAAKVPFSCRGGLTLADRAPVLACITDGGIGVVDLATGKQFLLPEAAATVALSPDGQLLAESSGSRLGIVKPFAPGAPQRELWLPSAPSLLAFSPRDPLLAFVSGGRLGVVLAENPAEPRFETRAIDDAAAIRWDEGGLDIALCKLGGHAEWYRLQTGGLPEGLGTPSGGCRHAGEHAPSEASRFSLGELSDLATGEHFSRAFRLGGGRTLSSTLALHAEKDDRLRRRIRFSLADSAGHPLPVAERDGFSEVLWHRGDVIVERSHQPQDVVSHTPPELVVARAKDGARRQSVRGHLLGACENDRVLAWRTEGDRFVVFEVRTGGLVASAPRRAGFVVGSGPSCLRWLTQGLDGSLWVHALDREDDPGVLLATAHGFVFDQKPSAAFEGAGTGMLLAFSSGEVARFDETLSTLRVLAHAEPRALGLADGAAPGEALFVDSSGLWLSGRDGKLERLAPAPASGIWEDIAVVAGQHAAVLAAVDGLSVFDLRTRAVVGLAPVRGMTRLVPWENGASLAAFAPDLEGLAHAVVLPFEHQGALAVSDLASNLRVGPGSRLELRK